jgi:hypothetical protein
VMIDAIRRAAQQRPGSCRAHPRPAAQTPRGRGTQAGRGSLHPRPPTQKNQAATADRVGRRSSPRRARDAALPEPTSPGAACRVRPPNPRSQSGA